MNMLSNSQCTSDAIAHQPEKPEKPESQHSSISLCGRYCFNHIRQWGQGKTLVAAMLYPSMEEGKNRNIDLLAQIARKNGYHGLTVVYAVPLRFDTPADAQNLAAQWGSGHVWTHQQALIERNHENANLQIAAADGILVAWGRTAKACANYLSSVLSLIESSAFKKGIGVFCLGKTVDGSPRQPIAYGKNRIDPSAPLLAWTA